MFFINGRYIKDKSLTVATDQAYKGIIPVGRYGFVVLNIQMDPKAVDVNVHPSKLEVRFEDESKVFKAVYHAIKSTLTNSKYNLDDSLDDLNFLNNNISTKKSKDVNKNSNNLMSFPSISLSK